MKLKFLTRCCFGVKSSVGKINRRETTNKRKFKEERAKPQEDEHDRGMKTELIEKIVESGGD